MANLLRWDTARWDPIREMEDFTERFGRLFGRMPARRDANGGEGMTVADWAPRVDITEDDKEYLIKAEIPEVDKKDVKVTAEDGILTIRGERRQEKQESNKRFHRVERSYGTFLRTFMLPDDVAAEQLKAEFKDGLLLVHAPKTGKPKSKTVEVTVG